MIKLQYSIPLVYAPPEKLISRKKNENAIYITPSSPHRLYDLQDILDKLTHSLSQLSDFVPFKNAFYSFRAKVG